MGSPHIIMLPLDGPINLDRTVDEVLMENPDQVIVIAHLDDQFEQVQQTEITIPMQQHYGPRTKQDDIHSISIKQENQKANITARFPQTMMICPEVQKTPIDKISNKKLTSSERYTPYIKKRETSSLSCKPLKSLSGNCMKFPQDVSRNFRASNDLQPRPSTSANTSEATRYAKELQRIPAKSAPSQMINTCAKMKRFHESGFMNTETSRSKMNMPFTKKGESSAVTFKYPKSPLDVSKNISATMKIQKKQLTSAKTSKATHKSKKQLKTLAKGSTSKLLTKKNKNRPTTYTQVPLHSTMPEKLNTELYTPPNVIRSSFSPIEIEDQPIIPSFFDDSLVILEASEQPTTSSEMFTNSSITHRAENQHTYFASAAKDVSLNSTHRGYPASSVGITCNFIDLTQPETPAPSTFYGDLSSDIRGNPFSYGYSEAPLFQEQGQMNNFELKRRLDAITASLIEDESVGNDYETIALEDFFQN